MTPSAALTPRWLLAAVPQMDLNRNRLSIFKAAKAAKKHNQFPLDTVEEYVGAAKIGIQGLEALDQMLAHIRRQSQVKRCPDQAVIPPWSRCHAMASRECVTRSHRLTLLSCPGWGRVAG